MKPEEIEEFIKALGVSQEKFARMLGTTVNSVNRWVNGKAKPSRLYIKEIRTLMGSNGSYVCRREKP